MNNSRFEPLKSRLREVFNASSSGDNPYGNPPPVPAAPKRKAVQEKSGWEQESEHLFEDFLSLDEEKITQGLAKARVRKAMEKKYGQARLSEENAAMEDTLQVEGVDIEKTRQKLVMASRFLEELRLFLHSRYPHLAHWLNPLDVQLWKHLVFEGIAPKFLLNLMIVAYYLQTELELWQQDRATMYLHLHVQLLGLNFTTEQIFQHVEKWTLDVDDFQSLLQQTYHALERDHAFFASFPVPAQAQAAQAYTLAELSGVPFNLETRLGQYALARNYARQQVRARNDLQRFHNHQHVDVSDLHDWVSRIQPQRRLFLRLFALRALSASVLPLDTEAIQQFDPIFQMPSLYGETLQELTGSRLREWAYPLKPLDPVPEYVSDEVLKQDILAAMEDNQLSTLEKWVQFKTYQAHLFRSQCLRNWQEVYQRLQQVS